MAIDQQRLAELLADEEWVAQGELERAKSAGAETSGGHHYSLVYILQEMGSLTAAQAAKFLEEHMGIPIRVLQKNDKVQWDQVALLGDDYCRDNLVLPLGVNKKNDSLVVAMADPADMSVIEEMRFIAEQDIEIVLVPPGKVAAIFENQKTSSSDDPGSNLGESKTVRVVNDIVTAAIRRKASDIHIEAGEEKVDVRYRIDGILHPVKHSIEKAELQAVIARLKILASLDISERRLPQDGRILFDTGRMKIDLRLSIVPGIHGESAVLRILDRSGMSFELAELGFQKNHLAAIRKHSTRPNGMILMTGPTGSGKTTTLYGILNEINTPEKKILTIEDPVEYQLEGILQLPARPDIGLDFAAGLRSFLRHDPDVIMVGEIRDQETAEIAVRAALTGHLVLSTLHTNDAPSAITRLVDMHVPPYLVSGTVSLVMAQRLVRKLCAKCRTKRGVKRAEIGELGLKGMVKEGASFYFPKGCSECDKTGYKGRKGVLEVLEITEDIRGLISAGESSFSIQKYLARKKHKGLLASALDDAKKGLTSLAEVVRVTLSD